MAESITLTENEQSGADENDPARDGEFSMQFSLNEEQPSLEKEIALSVPADITGPFTFEIGEEDITEMTDEPAGVEPKIELTVSPLQFTAAAQDGSASQTEEDGPEKTEPETAEPENGQEAKAVKSASLTKTVYWVDNNDEAETREAAKEALAENVKIFFSEEGGAYTQLTEENCGEFGLKELPEIGISEDATHSYIAADVPDAEGVTWKLETDPAAAEGYVFFDVREDNIGDYPALNEDPEKYGWYFVLTTDFTVTVEMKDGEKSSNTAVFTEAVNDQFHLQGDAKTGMIDMVFGDVDWKKPDVTSGISSVEMSCTVRKFNLDGSRITYKIVEYGENGPGNGILEVDDPESMEAGDYYKISFDNTGVPNFGAITEAAYDGGRSELCIGGRCPERRADRKLQGGSGRGCAGNPV